MKTIYLIIFVLALLVLIPLVLPITFSFSEKKEVNNRIIESYYECINLSIRDTAYCLRNYVRPYYNYTLDYQLSLNRDIEDVLEKGGSCIHYAKIYKEMAEDLGIKASYLNHDAIYDFNMMKLVLPAHRWTIIWDNETRCKIDQVNVDCREIE